jgi:WD40 repeat protein
VGKSTLAAELAQRLAEDGRLFPGGVLWANLLDEAPEDIARRWARDLGGDVQGLTPEDCIRRFHELAAAHRPLVVLDNVPRVERSSGPAARLLVRARGVATLLTTRFREAIPAGVALHEVDVLPPDEAVALLRTLAPAEVEAERESAQAVAEGCGRVPLFLEAAGRAVANGYYTLAGYAAELRARGLQALADEDDNAAVVFDLSWRFLSAPARELFAALALSPGESVGVNLALAWQRLSRAEGSGPPPARLLAELANASLLKGDERKRYRYHDRVRDYARSKLAMSETEARTRLLACYSDWDMVKAEFEAVGAFELAEQYLRLREAGGVGVADFVAWYHFIRGQAPVLGQRPELFFQQAHNEAKNSPVSLAAQARVGTAAEPTRWLEWTNRSEKFAPPACLMTLRGHTGGVYAVAVTADGRTAVSGSEDKTVRVWDLRNGSCSAVLQGHTGWVRAMAVSADGRTAVSGSEDKTVRVWDLRRGSCSAVLQGHMKRVWGVAVTADGHTAASGSEDKTVRVWDLLGGSCSAVLQGEMERVWGVAVTADGRTVVSGEDDSKVRVWDLRGGTCSAVLQGHTGWLHAVAVTADGHTAASGADDKTVRVWDLRNGSCSAVLQGHTGWVHAVAVTADGRTAISGAEDKTVRVWDLRSGSCSAALEGHTETVRAVAVTADGRTAVSGSRDKTVCVWDLQGGFCSAVSQGHTGWVHAAAVSADGHTAISGANDKMVRVWDLRSGSCSAVLQGHRETVRAVAVTADGHTAVSGSDDTVRVWDLRSGSCSAVLQGHRGRFRAVAVTADGCTAVSGAWDNTVRVWDLRNGSCSAVHQSDSPEAYAAWASVRGMGACHASLGNDDGVALCEAPETVLARFPGSFANAACSPDGNFLIAGDGRGQVYHLRLRGPGA